ncbi:hypothetical protein CTAYLR_004194 [Chrysophaeum taylorii]|uniref:ODAD1 central coiled coil region domain-containing protein n=1 Tax=Chrysophaeum taylorii TaxID=2483200 RepID=A0AAD7XNG3_9STRA|nr:hypothetical protein CTAYLR_004194 [Chrysophaeum taylorii]
MRDDDVLEVRQEIEKIQNTNEQLKQELARESRQARLTAQVMRSSQEHHGGEVERLEKEAQTYLRKIEIERKKIEVLDKKVAEAEKALCEQRQRMGGVNASKENHAMLTRQIKILENRLAKALQKFNEQNAANKQIRDRIDELRRERVVYDGIYKKLEKELHQKRKEMVAIIEDSKVAYQKSDKARAELKAMKAQVAKEKEDFEREWAELGRLMEQDRRERDALALRDAKSPDARPPRDVIEESVPSSKEDQAKKEEEKKPQPTQQQQQQQQQFTREQIQNFEETFANIKEATGATSIKELVDMFQDIEQKNFSLFNSINELNSDIEQSELAIAETKLEIERYKGQGVSTDTQRKKIIRSLEEQLARTEQKTEEYEVKHQNAQRNINQLKTGIHSIFSRLGCASTSVEEMLGNQGVTESNMMQYLEIIEQRTTEILQTYAQSQTASSGKVDLSQTSALEQGILQPATARLSVQPPTWDDFSSGDDSDQDDDERPLTREELQRKTFRFLGLKDNNLAQRAGGGGGPSSFTKNAAAAAVHTASSARGSASTQVPTI